jgi:glycosyltransferase involved in cell wall biosynthesis
MSMHKVSLIITVLKEEASINLLLESISAQSVLPNEIIIVDGGSTDNTVTKINTFAQKNKKLNLKIKIKKGNRSIGRNCAISLAKNNLIAITDAGCTLHKNWLKELLAVYKQSNAPVVAGFYAADSTKQPLSDFQKAIVPYALVMPDKVNPINFLPATRSMLIEKNIFLRLGGFDEKLNDNEDYAFANKIKKQKIKISFSKKAIAFWQPRETLSEFYNMILRFARGDVFAGIIRPKVILIFVRYFIFYLILNFSMNLFFASMIFYSVWAIQKNKSYVGDGWKHLPTLQFTSDIAVMHGSILGLIQKFIK